MLQELSEDISEEFHGKFLIDLLKNFRLSPTLLKKISEELQNKSGVVSGWIFQRHYLEELEFLDILPIKLLEELSAEKLIQSKWNFYTCCWWNYHRHFLLNFGKFRLNFGIFGEIPGGIPRGTSSGIPCKTPEIPGWSLLLLGKFVLEISGALRGTCGETCGVFHNGIPNGTCLNKFPVEFSEESSLELIQVFSVILVEEFSVEI